KQSYLKLFCFTLFMKKWTGKIERPLRIYTHPRITDDIYLHFSEIRDYIKKYSDKVYGRVLDIGAGKSPFKNFFKNTTEYIRLDKFDHNNKPDIIADATKMPLKKNSVDSVVCFQVLEHVQDPQNVINEIYRVLKKNGTCLLTTHMAAALHGEPYDYFRFTKYALKDVLFKKFKYVEIEANGGALLSIMQLIVWGISENLPRFIALPFIIFFNFIGKNLDKVFYNEVFTLNYIVYARK
ncbi:MAG: class I SAM-dependent methyltransferase, partial [Candidatus Altarchaeum sp.]|nr:class I SAM-dependent methyltransferase [Candidatus Altarchaeum sp.]